MQEPRDYNENLSPVPQERPGTYPIIGSGSYGYGSYLASSGDGEGIIQYWHLLRRHKLAVVCWMIAGGLIGYLLTAPRTPLYQAKASIEIQDVPPAMGNQKDFSQQSQPYSALP